MLKYTFRWPSATSSEEKKAENEDDFDLFGSDDEEEDDEKARITAERLKVKNFILFNYCKNSAWCF